MLLLLQVDAIFSAVPRVPFSLLYSERFSPYSKFAHKGLCVCMYGHHIYQSMYRPGKVANPARGQLNRENDVPLSPCVCVCVFIKLRVTAQSGPVILVILCHSH